MVVATWRPAASRSITVELQPTLASSDTSPSATVSSPLSSSLPPTTSTAAPSSQALQPSADTSPVSPSAPPAGTGGVAAGPAAADDGDGDDDGLYTTSDAEFYGIVAAVAVALAVIGFVLFHTLRTYTGDRASVQSIPPLHQKLIYLR